jgi:hypothetical protein
MREPTMAILATSVSISTAARRLALLPAGDQRLHRVDVVALDDERDPVALVRRRRLDDQPDVDLGVGQIAKTWGRCQG